MASAVPRPRGAGRTGGGGDDPVVATFDGEAIYLSELEQHAQGPLRQVEQTRYQILRRTLDQMVIERAVLDLAAERGMTREELMRAEVDDKVEAPSDAEVERFYEENKAKFQRDSQTMRASHFSVVEGPREGMSRVRIIDRERGDLVYPAGPELAARRGPTQP